MLAADVAVLDFLLASIGWRPQHNRYESARDRLNSRWRDTARSGCWKAMRHYKALGYRLLDGRRVLARDVVRRQTRIVRQSQSVPSNRMTPRLVGRA
jgi:hypothetical protein